MQALSVLFQQLILASCASFENLNENNSIIGTQGASFAQDNLDFAQSETYAGEISLTQRVGTDMVFAAIAGMYLTSSLAITLPRSKPKSVTTLKVLTMDTRK